MEINLEEISTKKKPQESIFNFWTMVVLLLKKLRRYMFVK